MTGTPELTVEIKDLSFDIQKNFRKVLRSKLKVDYNNVIKQAVLWAKFYAPNGGNLGKNWIGYRLQRNYYGQLKTKIRRAMIKDKVVKKITTRQSKSGVIYRAAIFNGDAFWGNFQGGTKSRVIGSKKHTLPKRYGKKGTKSYSRPANRGAINKSNWNHLDRAQRSVMQAKKLNKKMVKHSNWAFEQVVNSGDYETIKSGKSSRIDGVR